MPSSLVTARRTPPVPVYPWTKKEPTKEETEDTEVPYEDDDDDDDNNKPSCSRGTNPRSKEALRRRRLKKKQRRGYNVSVPPPLPRAKRRPRAKARALSPESVDEELYMAETQGEDGANCFNKVSLSL